VLSDERPGVTSRIRPAPGRKRRWQITPEQSFPLPVIVDHMYVDPATGATVWLVEATIDLIDGEPALVRMNAHVPGGIDPYRMQREFRWASPLEIVTTGVRGLLERGVDPFDVELPVSGFPEAAELQRPSNEQLSDAFLEEIAREYLEIGRGYAKEIAAQRRVSPRTVVSWVEKARRRGILTRVPQGGFGGTLVPKAKRQPS
jgi:transposase-like protein